MDACDLDLLPESARALVELIGLPSFQVLLNWRGGAYFNVPKKFDQRFELCRVVDKRAAEILIQHCAGEQIAIPRCAASARAAVRSDVVRRRRAGESEIAVALSYGLTVRWVRGALQRAAAEEKAKQRALDFG